MKYISSILNIILALAVAFLYYLHFWKSSNQVDVEVNNASNTIAPILPKEIKASKIVYVNADTLFDKYEYVKDLRKEMEGKQARLESSYKQKAQKLQEDYAGLQQRASNGTLSTDQAKVAEEDLMKRKADLDAMESQLRVLAEESQQKNLALQEKVNKFLKDYNKDGNYDYVLAFTNAGGSILLGNDNLNITKEVLDGLNVQYESEKANKNKK